MILGLLAMAAANVAAILGARAIVARLGTGVPHLDLVLLLLVRLACVSVAMIAAGLAGALSPWPIGIAGAVVAAALWFGGRRAPPTPIARPMLGTLLFALLGIVALRLVLQVWFFAPYNYDAVSYHLTKIPEWMRAGGFTREMGVDTHATFPAGFELVELWWVVFLRHDVLIEMAGVEFLALAAAAVFALARELGLSEKAAGWAALAAALVPGMQLGSTSCLNDVPVAALILVTALFIIAKGGWPWAVLAAGLGVGIKPTYAYALPGLALLAWFFAGRGPAPWKAALLGAIPALFWYVRNAVWFGNPVHPVGARGLVGGTGQLKIQVGPSLESGWRNLMALANQRVYDDTLAYGALLTHVSGWGAAAFAVGGVALWFWAREERRVVRLLAAFLVSLVSILFLVNHDPWCARFVLFFPALLMIAAAWLAERSKPVRWIFAAALAFQFLATMVPVDLRLEHAAILARQPWRERSFGAVLGSMPSTRDPVVYRILEPVHDRGESYVLYGPDYGREVVYFRGTTAHDLARLLEARPRAWLYAARVNPKSDPLLDELLRRGALRREGERLYRRP